MLIAIKHYLASNKIANLQQLALHFNIEPDMMRAMLQHWVRKGKLCQRAQPAGCGSRCQLCKPQVTEIYCWKE